MKAPTVDFIINLKHRKGCMRVVTYSPGFVPQPTAITNSLLNFFSMIRCMSYGSSVSLVYRDSVISRRDNSGSYGVISHT